jgi:hypothetical protein
MTLEIRFCNFCKKNISNSHRNREYCSSSCIHKSRYKRSGCRSTPEQRSTWYKNRKTKKGYIEKLRKQGNDRSRKIKEFLANYKLDRGCQDCGYSKHHTALDFDHVTGIKSINVCFAKSIAMAKKEIKKCEVVCSNCHRIRTYERLAKRLMRL